ncbi:hypothetical protein RJT34_29522 [Clitoria ternatea]|uniref:Avr9/Cf-9 rapidly elicited protein n=1 Tax=Clitoria ternatea TaxID=43366 RepID=A0AAN9ID68_CLITE
MSQAMDQIEPNYRPVMAKKLWNIVRIVFLMLRKGLAKSKVAMEFNLLLKRGKLAATKAIANTHLALNHRNNNQNDVVLFQEYEFSCSNSPAFPFQVSKYKHHPHRRHHRYHDVSTMNATIHKMLEMLNNDKNKVEASPLPGFRKSPIGKQLRITDSPFPLKDEEGDNQVDVAAEEFIKRFYKDLNLQQKLAAIESPCHYNSWDR